MRLNYVYYGQINIITLDHGPIGSSREKGEKKMKSTVNKSNVNKWSERMGGWKKFETRQAESENI